MKRILFFLICTICFAQVVLAQPATYSVPISIGRNKCGSGGTDSVYFFNYVSGSLTRASYPNAYRPRLKIGPASTIDRWSIFAASISYNPKDQKIYYLWTDYGNAIRATGTWTYIWRWKPDTTFTVGATVTGNFIDTLRSFPYDIGGVAFDNNGTGWTLEFPATAPATLAFFRPIDFAAGIYNTADTLDFVPSTGLGSKLYNVGSGDITMMPSGQIYYNFDNKLYTPDYGSYGGATHHIKSTFIDTTRKPSGSTALVGLAFGDGDLISSYATGCIYRRLDPVTGDTNYVGYTYASNKGVYSVDMTQLTSGIGSSKKLISVTPTGTPNQYDVVYDVYVRNFGTTPITNVQVTDDLSQINGILNVSNVTATLTSNPAGVALNPLYNGTTITTLMAAAQTLPNYPTSNNNFTIRISCRLSNIQQGVVYNNQAVTTANGFNNTALRDSSTNGNNPDLNQNDKPDDIGESQPTPFVVIITPITPPCATLAQTLYNQDFGGGAGKFNTIPPSVAVPSASTTYTGTITAPLSINRFMVTNNTINGDGTNYINLTDHTGGTNGRMLLINADAAARIAYADTLPVVCPGQQYSVSFWAAFVGNNAYKSVCDGLGGFKYSQLLVRVRDLTTGLVITQYTTDTIKLTSWQEHGMKWVMPSGYSQVILELVNAAPGGCGNDFALDDIKFGTCDPVPTVSLSVPGGCLGSSITFNSTLSDASIIPGAKDYQWQWSPAPGSGPWTSIAGATSSTYTINPIAAADTGRYYRVIVAAQGNIGNATCQYISTGIRLNGFAPSTAPASISAPSAVICNGSSVTLTATGGTLGTGANYQWGTGAVVGTNPIGGATNSTLNVSPTSTTTYWVRIENTTSPCTATTGGVSTTITVNQPSAAPTSVTGLDICTPNSTTLTALGGTLGTNANYQWGTGSVVGTSPIVGATNSTLTVSPVSTTTYWVRIENTAGPCTVNTSGLTKLITVSQPSVAAASANKNKNNVCPGISVQLSTTGGTLGTGASWKWYTGSPGGTLVGTGATLTVTPAVTTTYYVRAEGSCNTTSDVSVTVTISCNIDKDMDGIPDFVESNMAAAFTDANSNGVTNAYDPTYAGFVDYNNDFVNDNFQADGDSDNDGIPNYLDATFPGRVDTNADGVDDRFDQDKDGVINMLDLDSDNDGIPDVVEAYGVDNNGDAKIDNFIDADGDGLSDNVDTRVIAADGAYNTGTGLGLINLDGDALPNFLDTDSDNDGIPDIREVLATDANNDGKVDGFTDVNSDGLHDSYINAGALLITGTDGNADGRADSWPNKNLDRDLRPNAYDLDSDGDGIADAIEAGGGITDTNLDGLADGAIGTNGWSTTVSAFGTLTLRNTDSNGNPDYLDIDADDDGIPDNIEGMSTLSYQLPTTTDTDGDGLASPYDNLVGFGGSGIFVYDNDGDGIPDYRDLDTDGDGAPDICEGNDWDLNKICDEPLVLTGLDADGDGLDNLFDSLNSVTNLKGTSYMMGNGGSLTGDATPGTRATVQKKIPAQGDRDWRWTASVLPVQFLGFTGVMQNNVVNLNWSIIADKAVDHFEIERSTDNSSYTKVGIVSDAVQLNIQQSFGAADNIAGVNGDIFYYKLKVVGKAGEIKYSNVLVVRRSQTKTTVAVMPNPANDYVTVRFFVENESEVTIRLVDNIGKTVLQQKQKVTRGNNAVQLNGLVKYSSGVYTIQVLVNNEIATQKLVLTR